MKGNIKAKFKKGAASFYIVAFSTLILLIVVTSFAAVVISEIERTMNSDLSQSAYDSALAGVEDAKLAFYNYRNCVASGVNAANSIINDDNLTCGEIMYYMEHPDCDMVGHMLGRTKKSDSNQEVQVKEGASNNMSQAYTCTKITSPKDYRATLSSESQTRTIRAKFSNVLASDISHIKLSWYNKDDSMTGDKNGSIYSYTNFSSNHVTFPTIGSAKIAVPPTISIAMTQTTNEFKLEDFYATKGDRTDRGLIYLVPTENSVSGDGETTYRPSRWDDTNKVNVIDEEGFLKSNEKTVANLPYAVRCPKNSDAAFACSAMVYLPKPIGGERNDDTFLFTVSIPYGAPSTTFALEFFCETGVPCGEKVVSEDGTVKTVNENQAYLEGVQIAVDSTGRANDIYRRLDVRMDYGANSTGGSHSSLSIMGPLQLLGENGGAGGSTSTALDKNLVVTCEHNFGTPNC